MKAIKGVVLFCFLGLFVGSCFDPPEFSSGPEIIAHRVEFRVTPDIVDMDTLSVFIDFRDGDGDLGLNGDNLFHSSYPYNVLNFSLESGVGGLLEIGTVKSFIVDSRDIIIDTINVIYVPGNSADLITYKTRNKPEYSFLPVYDQDCPDYSIETLLIPEKYGIVDASYNIVDTLFDDDVAVPSEAVDDARYFAVYDTIYSIRNPHYFNIRVRFYQRIGSGLEEFVWEAEFCTTFNGRFPVLSDTERPLEGTIRYNMQSTGFIPIFSVRKIALDVIVYDRTLLKDSVRTAEFTLDEIRVN